LVKYRTLNESAKSLDDVLRNVMVLEGTDEVKFRKLTESTKKDIGGSMITSMFKSIKDKSLQVNYAEVEKTRGDITKLHGYSDLVTSISFLSKMASQNAGTAPKEIAELEACLQNIIRHKNDFQVSFARGNEAGIFLYNNLVVALVGATSFVVAATIEYVKDPLGIYSATFKKNLDASISANIYLSNVTKMNRYVQRGTLKTFFNNSSDLTLSESTENEAVDGHILVENTFSAISDALSKLTSGKVTSGIKSVGSFGGKATAVIVSIALILFWLRETVYFYYYSRTVISTNLKHLSAFVEVNSRNLGADKEVTKEKQEKIAMKLADLSDKISVESKVGARKTNQELSQENNGFRPVQAEGNFL